MSSGRHSHSRGLYNLGVSVLILSLVHTPLPQPDFHNIRHHDGPGEVCDHHDHLLRWHPGAGLARDVAVLHWHWFMPTVPGAAPVPGGGPAFHAHVPDWQASTWEHGPSLAPDTTARFAARPDAHPLLLLAAIPAVVSLAPDPSPRPPLTFSATFAPRTSLASLLQRWVC